MKLVKAAHLGMCFGVRDAIELALKQTEPVTILGELVHNQTVLNQLRSRGVRMEQDLAAVQTDQVMITAHGTSQRVVAEIGRRGLKVIEATCPLVHFAHHAVARLVSDGFHPIIIGQRDHAEVRGLTGDLKEFDVVNAEEDILQLTEHARLGIAAQTTQPIEKVRCLVALIENRFPSATVQFIDTVCQPTKQRQSAALDLAKISDVVIVIGGANSNNTRELAATCRRHCARVHQVQDATGLRSIWFTDADTIGLTAGTSTPDAIVQQVEDWLNDLADFQAKLSRHVSTPPVEETQGRANLGQPRG